MDNDELCPEARALIKWQQDNPDVWGDQDEYDVDEEKDVDLDRLRENLKLTPAERLQKHEKARRLAKPV